MSTFTNKFPQVSIILFILFLLSLKVFSQDIFVNLKISNDSNSVVQISGRLNKKNNPVSKNWSFPKNYADAENLEKRINNLKLFDAEGNEISVKKFADGEFVADALVEKFAYEIDLSVPENELLRAHISWVDKQQGMLMLNDLLPQLDRENVSAQINFELPDNWQISTGEKSVGNAEFQVENIEKAVFFVGQNWREKQFTVQNKKVNFVISGEWQFEDEQGAEMARSILSEYDELFGEIPFEQTQIYLIRFPKDIEFGRWRAETRGANAVILSSSMPFKNQAIQRLHEQLRHELFHLWIPNSLNLNGDYAWFYEGFAIYQALKTGIWLGQIRFEDFLNTLGQAYVINNRVERKFSLIEVSKNRWQGAGGSIYAKGLLVAFLCDLAILKESGGKRDLKNVFQEVYRQNNNSNKKKDANESILQVLNSFNELNFIVEKHIKGTEKIELEKYLDSIGIENAGTFSDAKFRLKSKLRGREKAILKKLGYNRWLEILRRN